ncbi:MAG: helix-turn-helix domain-containing protein, partial [Bacteroidota bacterium]
MADSLINSVRLIILENLDNENFGVKDLAGEVGISRFQLYRKIQLITNKSVSQFIREVRVEKALELLNKGEQTVSEIAYQVGFSSPSYFNKCFKEKYGFSPGEAKSNKNLLSRTQEIAIEYENNIGHAQTETQFNENRFSQTITRLIYREKTNYRTIKPVWLIAVSLTVIVLLSIIILQKDNLIFSNPNNTDSGVKYFNILLPEETPLSFSNTKQALSGQTAFDISPDGSKIVYASEINGVSKLVIRYVNQNNIKVLIGTDGAYSPFFSPDGLWIGYFTRGDAFRGKLKKVSISTGVSVDLCDVSHPFGGDWGENGIIVFANAQGSELKTISENGGMPTTLNTFFENKRFANWVTFPKFLPGENKIIASGYPVVIINIKTGNVKTLTESGNNVRYIGTGHLLFVRDSKLMAVPFNPGRDKITGNSFPLFEGIRTENLQSSGQYAISENGDLLFAEGAAASLTRFMWVNRKGEIIDTLNLPAAKYNSFSISPTGEHLAYTFEGQVWIYYLNDGRRTKVPASYNIYTPYINSENKKVIFCDSDLKQEHIQYYSFEGNNEIQTFTIFNGALDDWSTDSRFIGFHSNQNLYVYSFEKDTVLPVLETGYFESQIDFSHDSRYFSYLTDENGFLEIFVQPFPVTGEKWNVSNGFGIDPIWSFDGKEIFYRTNNQFYAVKVNTSSGFTFEKPELLFTNNSYVDVPLKSFAVSPDRQKILIVKAETYENT